jgi:hypothetical protein
MVKSKKGMSIAIICLIILVIVITLAGIYYLILKERNICKDTDDGVNYKEKGTICLNRECYTDYCEDSSKLREFACDNRYEEGDIDYKSYPCPNGCLDGVCVN